MHLELQLHCAHKNKIWNLPFTKILHLGNIIPLFAHYMKYLLFLNKPDFHVLNLGSRYVWIKTNMNQFLWIWKCYTIQFAWFCFDLNLRFFTMRKNKSCRMFINSIIFISTSMSKIMEFKYCWPLRSNRHCIWKDVN